MSVHLTETAYCTLMNSFFAPWFKVYGPTSLFNNHLEEAVSAGVVTFVQSFLGSHETCLPLTFRLGCRPLESDGHRVSATLPSRRHQGRWETMRCMTALWPTREDGEDCGSRCLVIVWLLTCLHLSLWIKETVPSHAPDPLLNKVHVRVDQRAVPGPVQIVTLELTVVGHSGLPSTTVLFYWGTAAHMWINLPVSEIHWFDRSWF